MATTKMRNRGKNINEILDPNNAPTDSKREALRRTILAKNLCSSRCTTSQELEQRFNELFEIAFNEGFIPTFEMLGLCSGFDRRSLWDIENGVTHKGDGMSVVVKNAKEVIAAAEGMLALDGELNATTYIFRGKNYFNMVDKQEVVVTPNTLPQAEMSEEEILKNLPKLNKGEC